MLSSTSCSTLTLFRVLVVEDDPIIRKIHQELLISLGCQVDCVSSGKQALRQLYYDLVLLDIGLPDISGENVIQTIRSKEAERKPLPITVVSAHGKENKKAYLDLGANHVFSKPITKEQLQSLLKIDAAQKKDDPIP